MSQIDATIEMLKDRSADVAEAVQDSVGAIASKLTDLVEPSRKETHRARWAWLPIALIMVAVVVIVVRRRRTASTPEAETASDEQVGSKPRRARTG
jgi:hypothetical protein